MTDLNELREQLASLIDQPDRDGTGWDDPVICRVEVDLPSWLTQLSGGSEWEVYDEDENEHFISFTLREKAPKKTPKTAPKTAEVTLYHSGYATVDVDGQALFDGTLTSETSDWAHLSYYHADSGELITLN